MSKEQKALVCPVCGSDDLNYVSSDFEGNYPSLLSNRIYYPWVCGYCKSTGLGVGHITFVEHQVRFYGTKEEEQKTSKNYHDGVPKQAFLIHPREPATVIRVAAGKPGYHVGVRLHDPESAKKLVDTLNGGHLDDAVAAACLCGSMFGWLVPGASPEAYKKKEYPMTNLEHTVRIINRATVCVFKESKKAERNERKEDADNLHAIWEDLVLAVTLLNKETSI